MLTRLAIADVVLFEACDVSFAGGLSVLTGETGAGKSLLLQSLDLALGARADASLIRKGAERALVTAEFADIAPALATELSELGIEHDGSIIIRRSVSADGKSKAWVNDVPITQGSLKTIGAQVIERHGQHDQRGLMDTKSHRAILDAQLGDVPARRAVKDAYARYNAVSTKLAELNELLSRSQREEAFLRMIVDELSALRPREGEEVELTEARTRYMNLQKNQESLQAALDALEGSHPARTALMSAQKQISRAAIGSETQEELMAALERAMSEIDDVSARISSMLHQPEDDADSLAGKEDRLFALRAAARKFHVSVEELAGFYETSRSSLEQLNDSTASVARAEKELTAARADYVSACEALSAARAKASTTLAKQVQGELKALNMADAQLRVVQDVLPEHHWGEHGNESVAFEIAPNKGQGFGPLNKIASGGELSRLLLAISVVLRGDNEGLCVIYDEIDAGTSGAVAEAIGVRLKKLAERQQVLAITHLPQVAACASQHIVIEKHAGAKHAYTTLRSLTEAERKDELARLISGKVVTAEAKRVADKLLQAAS